MPFLGSLSTTEWIIIGIVVFMIFGSKKLVELGRGLGESGREIKRVKKEFREAMKDVQEDPEEKDESK